MGSNQFKNKKDTVIVSTNASDSEDMIRQDLLQGIKRGLYEMCRNTPFEAVFTISLPPIADTLEQTTHDPWNYWVIAPGISGEYEGESNFSFTSLVAQMNIRRITHKSKFTLNIRYQYRFSRYRLDTVLQLGVQEFKASPLYVKSINEHWSMGGIGEYQLDEFRNVRLGMRAAPIVEYNFYPYSINSRKQLRLAYQVGMQYWEYIRITVFDKLEELRPYQRLSFVAEITQPWGSIRGVTTFNTYLDDWKQNRLSLKLNTALRLVEGLALTIEAEGSWINDQISLIKTPLDDTVYLLWGQQLPTRFNFYTEFGFSYTFGSIRNSIVNPRMGQVE
ncbi:MAG: hypothetical protein MUE33_02370 [Cytophagaceae bacterium]|nr:hypothetical protein [Cytophagaceae bacterium]